VCVTVCLCVRVCVCGTWLRAGFVGVVGSLWLVGLGIGRVVGLVG
jgi:hypothetical protein